MPSSQDQEQHKVICISAIRQDKRNKRHTDWKEGVKLPLLANDIIVHVDKS